MNSFYYKYCEGKTYKVNNNLGFLKAKLIKNDTKQKKIKKYTKRIH